MESQSDLNHLTYVEVSCWLQEESIAQPQRVLLGHEGVFQVAYPNVGLGVAGLRSIGFDGAECERFGMVKASVRQAQVFQDRGMDWWC